MFNAPLEYQMAIDVRKHYVIALYRGGAEMVANAEFGSHESADPASRPRRLAELIIVAKQHDDPNCRHGALERLLPRLQAPAMVQILIDRLKRDSDMWILWACLGWLLQRYGEDHDATKAILARLEREPDPALRINILRLVSLRLGTSDPVRRTVARMADKDPDDAVRVDAMKTLAELERLRFAPSAPVAASHSPRQIEDWAAVWITDHRPTS